MCGTFDTKSKCKTRTSGQLYRWDIKYTKRVKYRPVVPRIVNSFCFHPGKKIRNDDGNQYNNTEQS